MSEPVEQILHYHDAVLEVRVAKVELYLKDAIGDLCISCLVARVMRGRRAGASPRSKVIAA